MLIIIFVILFFLILTVFIKFENKKSEKILYFLFGFILIIIAGFRGEGLDRDYLNYVEMFNEIGNEPVEPGFLLISKIIHSFVGPYSICLFVFFAIFGVTFKLIAIRQLTKLWFLSLLIYFTNFFILHEMTQIRVGIASAFLLLCIRPIYERNFKSFLLFTILGFCFHYTAILILPLWFVGYKFKKAWLILSIPIGYLIYFIGLNMIGVIPIPGIQEKIELYKNFEELGYVEREVVNVFSFVFLIRVFVFYFIIWKYDLIVLKNKFAYILVNIYSIGLMSYLFFANMPVFAIRISELFLVVEIILIPFLVYVFKPIMFGKSIVLSIALCIFFIFIFYTKLLNY